MTKPTCSCYQLTSRCFVASWLRDMSSSLVLRLRRCMSLSKDTRLTVASLMDYTHTHTTHTQERKERINMLSFFPCRGQNGKMSYSSVDGLDINIQMSPQGYSKPVTTITSWLVSGQYEMRQAPTAFLNSLWAFSPWHL